MIDNLIINDGDDWSFASTYIRKWEIYERWTILGTEKNCKRQMEGSYLQVNDIQLTNAD